MLADYVMKGIDSLFSEKLHNHPSNHISKNNFSKNSEGRAKFNKEYIKNSLHTIIKKDGNTSKSPQSKIDKSSPSPISKSRLKVILESNKDERLKSVVKRVSNFKR
jgi:hypothetical protein